MAKAKEPVNPFYVLLAAAGAAFVVTACAYATMLYRSVHPPAPGAAGEKLMQLLDKHGMQVLSWELVILGAATFLAMWLDRFRSQQAVAAPDDDEETPGRMPRDGQIR